MKLIVIEGIDGSGKQTQAELLAKSLNCPKISFPNYENKSSTFVKMYLNGEFGKQANEISPYAASSFYAIDRFAFFNQNKQILQEEFVVADRYTTSNIIHQVSKTADKLAFLNWLEDYEYNLLSIPKPDKIFFLNVTPATSHKLSLNRAKKFQGNDIHESDLEYMQKCYETAIWAAKECGWEIIECEQNGEMLGIDKIHNEIKNKIS